MQHSILRLTGTHESHQPRQSLLQRLQPDEEWILEGEELPCGAFGGDVPVREPSLQPRGTPNGGAVLLPMLLLLLLQRREKRWDLTALLLAPPSPMLLLPLQPLPVLPLLLLLLLPPLPLLPLLPLLLLPPPLLLVLLPSLLSLLTSALGL